MSHLGRCRRLAAFGVGCEETVHGFVDAGFVVEGYTTRGVRCWGGGSGGGRERLEI